MIRPSLIWLLSVLSLAATAQSLSDAQQKALNNYIELINQCTSQLYELGPSLVTPYDRMLEYRKKARVVSPYTCRLSAKDYYYGEARKTAPALGGAAGAFIAKAESAYKAFQQIDETCKAIEIYFRLKDYESDNFAKFDQLMQTMADQSVAYRKLVGELQKETEGLYAKLQPHNASNAYHKADRLMRNQLVFERELIDAFSYNINAGVHTGWPVELTQKHILEDGKRLTPLKQTGAGLQHPASSMYNSFVEGIESLQSTKRNGVDGYTYEKQQSDEHSNNVYKNLVNYYNNVAVSFYNNFIKMSIQNNFRGAYYLNVVPVFGIQTKVKEMKLEVTPFADKTVPELKVAPVATAIAPPVFASLSNYIEFLNEGVRQVNHLMNPIHSLNTYASTAKSRMKSGSRVNLDYHHTNFELPVTLYQQTIEQTKSLPANLQKPLTDQAGVIYAILTELNQWNNLLLAGSASKQLTKDSMEHVYAVIERYKVLVGIFDERKERLYSDVRRVFESYKRADPKNSWEVSGSALFGLLNEDRKQLMNAKQSLLSNTPGGTNAEEIERLARDLIANEYTNLAGIQKYGRSHGLCPYSPYEDLATNSRRFTESIEKAQQGKFSSYYRHPYNELVSYYNQSLLEHYNKFADLAKVPLLKSASQTQIYEVVPQREVEVRKPDAPVQAEAIAVTQPEHPQVAAVSVDQPPAAKQKGRKNETTRRAEQPVTGGVVRDTVRITDVIRIETVRQDTVHVARVDTVYIGMPGENMLSMEGYATNNMVLLLDVSGSMNNPDRLPLLKKSVLLLIQMMRPEDQVSIITFSGKPKVELPPTSFKEEEKISKVIERLRPEGKTDANAGIKLAYQVADKNYIRGGNNRIILATDGEFPIGKPTYDLVKKSADQDVFITVFNFGKNTVSTKNLQQLAELGRGNYEYVTRENVDHKLILEAKAKRKR